MKKTAVAAAILASLALAGCSTSGSKFGNLSPSDEVRTPVKDARVSTEFRDQGIKISYTLMGKLEKIEVFGIAPAWKGNYEIAAEMDAKVKLMKFVHGETVSSETKTRVLTRSLDRARDNTVNTFDNNRELSFDSEDLDSAPKTGDADDNTSRRTAERIERSLLDTTNTITASGRLTGVRKTGESRSKDGRYYIARYEWSEQAQGVSELLRSRMK